METLNLDSVEERNANNQAIYVPSDGYMGFGGTDQTTWYAGYDSNAGGLIISKANEPAFAFKGEGVIERADGSKIIFDTDPTPTGELTSATWDRSLYQIAYRTYEADENIELTNYTPYSTGTLFATGTGQFSFMGSLITPNESGRTIISYDYWSGQLNFKTDGIIILLSAPEITTQPIDESLTSGDQLDLSVDFTGVPTPTVQWQYSADNITFANISGATSKHYTKTSVTGDAGYYKAVASNFQGMATSNIAHIVVNAGPVIILQPTDETLTAGDTIDLLVDVTGVPTPTIQWQYSADNTTFADISDATYKHYTKTSVTSDSGYYKAVVTNLEGMVTSDVVHVAINAVLSPQVVLAATPLPTNGDSNGSTMDVEEDTSNGGHIYHRSAGNGGNFAVLEFVKKFGSSSGVFAEELAPANSADFAGMSVKFPTAGALYFGSYGGPQYINSVQKSGVELLSGALATGGGNYIGFRKNVVSGVATWTIETGADANLGTVIFTFDTSNSSEYSSSPAVIECYPTDGNQRSCGNPMGINLLDNSL